MDSVLPEGEINLSNLQYSELLQACESLKQTNLKLAKKNADCRLQIMEQDELIQTLRTNSFDIELKYNGLQMLLKKINSTLKYGLPNLVTFSKVFTDLVRISSPGSSNGTPDRVKTHAVKPQIVNGHVLQVPTISLTRLTNEPQAPLEADEIENRVLENLETDEIESVDGEDEDVDVERFVDTRLPEFTNVNRRARRNKDNFVESESETEEETMTNDVDPEVEPSNEYFSRLHTIDEEESPEETSSPSILMNSGNKLSKTVSFNVNGTVLPCGSKYKNNRSNSNNSFTNNNVVSPSISTSSSLTDINNIEQESNTLLENYSRFNEKVSLLASLQLSPSRSMPTSTPFKLRTRSSFVQYVTERDRKKHNNSGSPPKVDENQEVVIATTKKRGRGRPVIKKERESDVEALKSLRVSLVRTPTNFDDVLTNSNKRKDEDVNDETDSAVRKRPRRAKAPVCLKELKVGRKMRRD